MRLIRSKVSAPISNLAAFHHGKTVLANASAFGEILLRHIKTSHLPNAATCLITGSLPADRLAPATLWEEVSIFTNSDPYLNITRNLWSC